MMYAFQKSWVNPNAAFTIRTKAVRGTAPAARYSNGRHGPLDLLRTIAKPTPARAAHATTGTAWTFAKNAAETSAPSSAAGHFHSIGFWTIRSAAQIASEMINNDTVS